MLIGKHSHKYMVFLFLLSFFYDDSEVVVCMQILVIFYIAHDAPICYCCGVLTPGGETATTKRFFILRSLNVCSSKGVVHSMEISPAELIGFSPCRPADGRRWWLCKEGKFFPKSGETQPPAPPHTGSIFYLSTDTCHLQPGLVRGHSTDAGIPSLAVWTSGL